MESVQRKPPMYSLNAWRLLFAFMVFCLHYSGNLCGDSYPIKCLGFFYRYGGCGVEFFFVLSGFLIAYNYKDIISKMSFKEFWGGRIKKFYPYVIIGVVYSAILTLMDKTFIHSGVYENQKLSMYSIFISLSIVLRGLVGGTTGRDLLCGVLWYVCVLAICYIVYYVICQLKCRLKMSHEYMPFICMSLGFVVLLREIDRDFISIEIARGFTGFFIGVLLWEIQEHIDLTKVAKWLMLLLGLITGLSVWKGVDTILGNVRIVLVGIIYPSIIIITLNITVINTILSHRIFGILSRYCTAMYITHGETIHLIKMFNLFGNVDYSKPVIFWGILATCITVAILTEHVVCIIRKTAPNCVRKKCNCK